MFGMNGHVYDPKMLQKGNTRFQASCPGPATGLILSPI